MRQDVTELKLNYWTHNFGVNDCRRDLDALGQRLGFDYSTLHEF